MITKELIFNFVLLLSASTLANLLNLISVLSTNTRKILLGIVFGIVAVIGMKFPYTMAQGLIFDGRSIVISLVSLFYGFRSGLIVGTIALIYRIIIGGPGVYAGSLTIFFSMLIGLVFHFYYFKKQKFEFNNKILFVFNFFVHFVVYISMIFLQGYLKDIVLQQMAVPFLIFYPITGFIIGKILWIQNDYIDKANKLKESEEKFSIIFYKSVVPLMLIDAKELKLKEVNDAFLILCETEKSEILNKSLLELGIFENNTLKEIIIPKIRANATIKTFETKMFTQSGKAIDVIFVYENVVINRMDFYLISLIDISVQKQAFDEIIKLNKAYLNLSEINQLIVRSNDPDVLLKRACEISVKESNFILVWIGIIDNSEKSLRLYCAEGLAKEYVENLKLAFDDPAFKDYPALKCIKDKKFKIVNDWESNAAAKYFKDLAKKFGISSSAYFPLFSKGSMIGTINFYSAEKNYFDSAEIALFDEISKDLSYALDSIENERRRREFEFKLQENVRFLSTLIKNLPGFIFRCRNDRDWTMEYLTPQVEEITGYKPEELIYNRDLSFNDIIQQEYRDLLWEKWQDILAKKAVFQYEYPIITKSGELRWVWERGRGIFDENDQLICLEGFITDITEKKKFEEQLLETNEKLKLLVEGIPYFFFYTHDIEGRIIYISPSVEKITGYSVSEWIGTNHWFLTENPMNELTRLNTKKVLRGEPGHFPTYIEIFHKNGEKIILEIFEVPHYKEGKIVGLHGVARDVTIEKRYEEKLIRSETRFRKLFEEHSAVKIILDPTNGKIFDVNNAALKFYGYSFDEMKNKMMSELILEPIENIWKKVSEAKEKGIPNIETKHKLKDGSIKDVSVFFSDVEIDGKNYVHLIVVDISEAKKLEKEIEIERYKFQQLFDNSPISIAMIDKQMKISLINLEFLKFFNLNIDKPLGEDITKLCCKEESTQNFRNFLKKVLEGGKESKETYIQKPDGSIAYVQLIGFPVFIQAEIIGAFILFVDITKIKKAEEDMKAAKELAELANKMKDTFIANISHEIRTPLNAILGYNELIKEVTLDLLSQEEKNYFNVIRTAGDRLMRTIEMIMNYSRIVSGDMPVKKEKISLNEIVGNLCEEFKITANHKSLDFIYINECGDVKIFADKYCITQAIANLIDNAIKYTKKGNVKISLRRNENSEVELEISDTGIGISEEYQKRIFEPYTQQELGWNRPYEGVGLGLVLVKNYLNLNGIDLTFTSKENVGTTFIIHFKDTEVKD
ncbi:MAG: PAS domain S-box protein [Ignavibacteria bacterium]|jgi:PAS domain S-box-containing protein|nr:PAS domain S-box protein [Ignavibacteria bacterium]MDH7527116.1 PAS domain S-box protein [Ignavibacteria bacterium]